MIVASPGTQEPMDSTHPQAVLSKLNEQRFQGLFCDVTIVVEDVKFQAHRNILAACSGYFRQALMSPEARSSSQVLELLDLKSDVFASILNFIYCSKVAPHGTEDAGGLMAAGKRLGIPFLERLTEQERQGSGVPQTVAGGGVDTTDASKAPKKTKKEAPRPEELYSARGPRITNAFSITEVGPGSDPFTPLVLSNGERRSPDVRRLPASCPAASRFTADNESTHALSEHSYAVSQATEHRDCSQGDNKKISKPSQSQPKQLANRNTGPLKKRHRLRGTLGRSILPAPAVPHTYIPTTDGPTLPDGVMTPAVTTPPSLFFEAGTEKCTDTGPTINTENIQPELDSPTLSPHAEHSISIYSCEYCPDIFTSEALLTLHTEVHKKRFVSHLFCKFCHRKFMHLKRLRNHEQVCPKASRDPPDELDPSDKEDGAVDFPSDNTQSSDNAVAETQPSPEGLSAPVSPDPLGMDELEAQQAAERTRKPGGGQRVYNCSVCKRIYITLSSLRRHENVHSWQRAYPCHYCNKVFALAEYRTKHEVWHTGERRYQCIFCLETFMTYYILKNHQKAFHGIDPRLAVNKKLANGGFKASVYPIKLYRLLPMRFRKRGYKTYSQTYSKEVDGGDQAPLDCSSPIPQLEENAILRNTDPVSFSMPVTFMATPKMVASVMPHISFDQPCKQGIDQSLNAEVEKCHQGGTGKEAEHRGASLIGFDYTSPIQPDGESTAFMNLEHTSHSLAFLGKSMSTADKLGELSAAAKKVEAMTKQILQSETDSLAPETETYIAKSACPGPSVDGDTLPLCQITVKIGNEAIIRRRIKGSVLFPSKRKKTRPYRLGGSPDQCSAESTTSRLRTDLHSAVESGIGDDHDTADELWRPYYSYKPKKKSKKLRFRHRKERQYSYPPAPVARPTSSEAYPDRRSRGVDDGILAVGGEGKHSLRNNSPRANYTCDICDSSFITQSGLRAHIIGSHPCFCRTCGKQGPPGEAPAGGDYVCESCMENGSCFDNTPRSPGTEKKYHCSVCPQRFLYLATKRSHERKHQQTKHPARTKHSVRLDEDEIQQTIKTEDSDDQESIDMRNNVLGRGQFSVEKTEPRDTGEEKAGPVSVVPKTHQEISNFKIKSPASPPCTDTLPPLSPPKLKHKKAQKITNMQHSAHLNSKKQAYYSEKASYKGQLARPRTNNHDDYEQPSHPVWKTNSDMKGALISTHKSEKWVCKQEPSFDDHYT